MSNETWPLWSEADAARRARSVALMDSRGIPHMPRLPMITQAEAGCRAPEEIARRLLAMFGVCVYCEVRSGGAAREETDKYLRRIDGMLPGGLTGALTPAEARFLAVEPPVQQDLANFGWRYECCHVLMWALGIAPELGFPGGICDVSAMGGIIWRLEDVADLLSQAAPRPEAELLDAADVVLLYDWACVDARINRRTAPGGLNGEVVMEWHHATNWLVGAYENADWDQVGTDT